MNDQVIKVLQQGGLVVMPTDTIYGICADALNSAAVERLYQVRKRTPTKPLIVLIADMGDLKHFQIVPTSAQSAFLEKNWPASLSVILPCLSEQFAYLHRGTKTLAIRLPADEGLRSLIRQTGPLVAPSANPEGLVPAKTVAEARAYFGDQVDFYQDGGLIEGRASTLVSVVDDKPVVLREGAVTITL